MSALSPAGNYRSEVIRMYNTTSDAMKCTTLDYAETSLWHFLHSSPAEKNDASPQTAGDANGACLPDPALLFLL